MSEQEAKRQAAKPGRCRRLGPSEIARHYGVTRQTVYNWRRRPDFPAEVEPGRWALKNLGEWRRKEAGRQLGHRGAAVTQFREGRTISEVSRSIGVSRTTIRRWLRASGDLIDREETHG